MNRAQLEARLAELLGCIEYYYNITQRPGTVSLFRAARDAYEACLETHNHYTHILETQY